MRIISILCLAVLLGGCAILPANWSTTAIPFNPKHGQSRLIEADLRAIISAERRVIGHDGLPKIERDGKPVVNLAICAEPSPDALRATASALGLQISGKKGQQALFNASVADSVASIGLRTQTIQLLRDAYYRLCEAYLNDGIDSIAYDVLQRRFQNQIVAFLAVEQLTGAVKADQVALVTGAAGQTRERAEAIAQKLKEAEEELPRLQDEQGKNETKLAELEEKGEQLKTEKETAEKNAKENEDKDGKLKAKADQAKIALDLNDKEIEAAQRRKTVLNSQIERKQKQIETLTEAIAAAPAATVTSGASGAALFTGGDDGADSPAAKVVGAVRAIALSAMNQDYEAQVCFETLRPRNNVDQFKNDVSRVFSGGDSRRVQDVKSHTTLSYKNSSHDRDVFVNHCRGLFVQQSELRAARANVVNTYADAVTTLVKKVGRGEEDISAQDVATLFLALSQALPLEPGAAFLERTFSLGDSVPQAPLHSKVPEPEQEQVPAEDLPYIYGEEKS